MSDCKKRVQDIAKRLKELKESSKKTLQLPTEIANELTKLYKPDLQEFLEGVRAAGLAPSKKGEQL